VPECRDRPDLVAHHRDEFCGEFGLVGIRPAREHDVPVVALPQGRDGSGRKREFDHDVALGERVHVVTVLVDDLDAKTGHGERRRARRRRHPACRSSALKQVLSIPSGNQR
jgi:hypothetical protein